MKKEIIAGIIMLILITCLSGCVGDTVREINLGDSVTHGTIKVTFLSATWKEQSDWSYGHYSINVQAEYIGTSEDSVFVIIKKYEMTNGYTYSDDYTWDYISLNPGKSETSEIDSGYGVIDSDFLPVAKIYITLDENANPMLPEENPIHIILNV